MRKRGCRCVTFRIVPAYAARRRGRGKLDATEPEKALFCAFGNPADSTAAMSDRSRIFSRSCAVALRGWKRPRELIYSTLTYDRLSTLLTILAHSVSSVPRRDCIFKSSLFLQSDNTRGGFHVSHKQQQQPQNVLNAVLHLFRKVVTTKFCSPK